MKFLFTGGGTAGHINPAIAMAKYVRARRPEDEIVFAGARGGMEEKLVPREGFRLESIDIQGFCRRLTPAALLSNLVSLGKIAGSLGHARRLLHALKPDVVVGTGGYACFPILYVAAKEKIPTVLHESNALPGRTARLLGRFVDKILLGFDDASAYFSHKDRIVLTGNPVREDMLMARSEEARRELGIGGRKLVLSYFGSLGARDMNRIMADFIGYAQNDGEFYLIHSSGSFGWKWLPQMLRDRGLPPEELKNAEIREYIHDMPRVMAAADLVLCRAGAMTMTELCVTGTPAVIIPSPNVADNHQEKNARALGSRGGAVVMLERECTARKLYDTVKSLLDDEAKLKDMAASLQKMAILDSADRIYEQIILSAMKSPGRS